MKAGSVTQRKADSKTGLDSRSFPVIKALGKQPLPHFKITRSPVMKITSDEEITRGHQAVVSKPGRTLETHEALNSAAPWALALGV